MLKALISPLFHLQKHFTPQIEALSMMHMLFRHKIALVPISHIEVAVDCQNCAKNNIFGRNSIDCLFPQAPIYTQFDLQRCFTPQIKALEVLHMLIWFKMSQYHYKTILSYRNCTQTSFFIKFCRHIHRFNHG